MCLSSVNHNSNLKQLENILKLNLALNNKFLILRLINYNTYILYNKKCKQAGLLLCNTVSFEYPI